MSRRLMLVHAHPDDETIGTGITMAKYAAEGVDVTLVTCTLGEQGEVLLDEFAHLAADQEDRLGEHRQTELAAAMSELGVTDWRLLGGPGRFRDSGMMGEKSNDHSEAFWRADLLAAATELVGVIREVRPQVLITYDDFGGYGHPDHIQAHRVAHYAMTLAAAPSFRPDLGPAWHVLKVYWTAFPRSVIREGVAALRAADSDHEFAAMDPDEVPFACDDELVTTVVHGVEFLPKKMAALRAHGTQVSVDGGFFALSNNIGAQVFGSEYFRLVAGELGADRDAAGLETDVFAGIDT
jgi:N-acetyl-1-D-myo-inositol-2-amino-2-deoxy-alpha-D-glucopyranoside deacetylase